MYIYSIKIYTLGGGHFLCWHRGRRGLQFFGKNFRAPPSWPEKKSCPPKMTEKKIVPPQKNFFSKCTKNVFYSLLNGSPTPKPLLRVYLGHPSPHCTASTSTYGYLIHHIFLDSLLTGECTSRISNSSVINQFKTREVVIGENGFRE